MVPVLVRGDYPLYRLCRGLLAVTVGVAYRLRSEGTETLPRQGPQLIAVNHKSDLDPVFAGISFKRPLMFMAKVELFGVPVLGRLIKGLGAFPVRRGEGDRAALEWSLQCLADGQGLLVFPEGTRFRDDEIHEFLPGIGMLAIKSGAPVIPVAVHGSKSALRKGGPYFQQVRVKAGPPVDLSGLEGPRRAVYSQAAERIRDAVVALYEELDRQA